MVFTDFICYTLVTFAKFQILYYLIVYNIMLKINETVPTLKLEITLETYGMQIKGAVPKLALIDRDAPKDMMNNEII